MRFSTSFEVRMILIRYFLSNEIVKNYRLRSLLKNDNLVPRSLVDEAEGEIWQSKKICFS